MDQNLREQVLQRVRAEIILGQSLPGAMYSVPTLAADLGVSTTPVREALLELARNGLIEPMRNRGFKVTATTHEDLRNLFDVRELVEVRAAEILANRPRSPWSGYILLLTTSGMRWLPTISASIWRRTGAFTALSSPPPATGC